MNAYTIESHQYPEFSVSLKERFNSVVAGGAKLFTTDAADLFSIFLDNLPEERQHYTCNCCKHFINRFGGLVTITEAGKVVSALWDESTTPEFFRRSVVEMNKAVLEAKVTGVFLSDTAALGQPVAGGWEHMSATLPQGMVHRSRLKTAGQETAEKREEHRMLNSALQEYPTGVVDQALTLLKSEALYRSDRVLGVAEWFKALQEKLEAGKDSRVKANIKWLTVATAPPGFCHVKSSMIGTLLDDLAAGYSIDAVTRRFAEKMNPGNHMRSQVAPDQGNIQQAEKIVEKLGITDSLRRRYAKFEEIPHFLWQDRGATRKATEAKRPGGVFASIAPKGASASEPGVMALPNTAMTWEKFQRTVLPTAEIIEAKVDNPNRLMAIVTAADLEAPNILQWGNPFSWYYHGGIDGEIRRRVEAAGGRYENNEIRCSLIWENYTDLDLHCITPGGREIYFGAKCAGAGWLDVDKNVSPETTEPVENIRWPAGTAPIGRYRFYVHNYTERGGGTTPFKVELEVNGRVYTFQGAVRSREQVEVFTFSHVTGQHPNIASSGSYNADDSWSVPAGSFVKVTGITESPNQWGEAKAPHSGHHVFFLLEGCRDKSEGKGRGFFNEMLKSELREVRKTLEAYTANTPIEDAESASACGVGYSTDSEWNLSLKVTANNSTRLITIDRRD